MSKNKKNKEKSQKDFQNILDAGAKVDDIFKDTPLPKGSDPFIHIPQRQAEISTESLIEPQLESIETFNETFNTSNLVMTNPDVAPVVLEDQESLFSLNRKYKALEALFELFSKDCTFQSMLDQILEIAVSQIKCEASSFLEIDYEKNCIFFRCVQGRNESSSNLYQFTIPLGKGVVGFVCKNQQTMRLSKIDENSIYLKSVSDSVGFETSNLIAVPIVINGTTFGCIELLNRLGEDHFTDEDREVLQCIAYYAAKVIEHRLQLAQWHRELTGGESSNNDDGKMAA